MEKINIAELLKDCPKGMELDCTMFDNVTFDRVADNGIWIEHNNSMNRKHYSFLCNDGSFPIPNLHSLSTKCIIFPKGKTTWEGFHKPFKDGDIIYFLTEHNNEYITIFKDSTNTYLETYIDFVIITSKCSLDSSFYIDNIKKQRFATKEEKQKLFDAIKANGYHWNTETKTLEKLIEPKFKVGDRVRCIYNNYQYDIKEITDINYILIEVKDKFEYPIPINADEDWELVSNKFNIDTLKPFDKVLTRCSTLEKWHIQFFEKYDETYKHPFICMGYNKYKECIPYEGNEHLLDTTDNCDDFYKI